VSDIVVVEELLNFMLNHTVYFQADTTLTAGEVAAAATFGADNPSDCHSTKVRNSASAVADYFVGRLQVADEVDVYEVIPPVVYESPLPGDSVPIGCFQVNNSFFIALP
jgi:hypothetical protein